MRLSKSLTSGCSKTLGDSAAQALRAQTIQKPPKNHPNTRQVKQTAAALRASLGQSYPGRFTVASQSGRHFKLASQGFCKLAFVHQQRKDSM